jgi:outer membrane immunogenic protein
LTAHAADLPPVSPPPQAPVAYVPAPPPVYNWGGVYIGINGGWGFGTAKWTASLPAGVLSSSANANGGIVGGTLGANFQAGAFVFGVEGDWDYSGINTGTSSTVCAVIGTCQTGNNWLSTVRGRAGFAADRALFYATAGGVFGSMQTALNGVTSTKTQAGWTAGLGVEYAFAQNWTAKIEYLYADLGTGSFVCTTGPCTGAPGTVAVGLTDNLIRVGVNYKFNF